MFPSCEFKYSKYQTGPIGQRLWTQLKRLYLTVGFGDTPRRESLSGHESDLLSLVAPPEKAEGKLINYYYNHYYCGL